jgi:phosphoglycolate phosphatase-like HAD superfamily hydrolase
MFTELVDKTIIYVGDHEGDVIFTRNIAGRVCSSNTLISVAVSYSGGRPDTWENQPDHIIGHPEELLSIVFD